jgi:hypothetical protein
MQANLCYIFTVMVVKVENKRRFPRIRIQTPVRYQIRGRPEFTNTIADNISVGGLSFVNTDFIGPSTNLNLEINILFRILNPTARVSWAQPLLHSDRYKLGIEFIELEPVQKNYLSDYIDMQMGKI